MPLALPGLEDPSLGTIVLVSAIVGLGALIHGMFGLGFGLIVTPLLALLTDVRSAIYITLVPTVALNVLSILQGGGWRGSLARYWPITLWVLFGVFLGTRALLAMDPAPFLLLLAGVILLYLNLDRVRRLDLGWIKRKPGLSYALFGTVGGFTGGSVNAMVPPLVILCLELGMAPVAMVQVFNFNFLMGKAVQIAVFFDAGTVTGTELLGSAPLTLAALTTLFVGMKIRSRLDEARYRGVLRGVLWAMAALLAVRFFWEML